MANPSRAGITKFFTSSFPPKIGLRRPEISLKTYLELTSLAIVIFVGVTIRLSGFRYGFYLSEFDSYWHLRSAEYIEENGLEAFYTWIDHMSWYPWGRAAGPSTPPGLPLLAAAIHKFITLLGFSVDITTLAILFPPVSSIIAIISVYLLTTDLAGAPAGLLSALFLAINGSNIERTDLGFFKHETIGVPAIVLSTLFFLKAVKSKDYRYSVIFALASGLTLGYLMISWTAYVFQIGLVALITILCLFTKNASVDNLLVNYSITQGVALLIATQTPRSASEMSSFYMLVIMATMALLLATKASSVIKARRIKITLYVGILGAASVLMLFLVQLGLLGSLYGKLIAIINPSIRIDQAIIESVAEHKIPNWYSLFMDSGFLLLFFGVAVLNSLRKMDINGIFIFGGGLSSLYFANMMARLGLIFSPFLVVLSAIGISELVENSQAAYQAVSKKQRRGVATFAHSERLAPLLLITLVFFLIALRVVYIPPLETIIPGLSIIHTNLGTPVTIAAASTPYKYNFPDWLEAVTWIRENTPPGSVVCAWWDYGYWITTLGNRPTLIDNATINSTQIALVGKAFISNETVSLPIMKRLNVSYVTVFTTLSQNQYVGFWGDEVKWIWMAEIGYDMKSEPLTHATALAEFSDPDLSSKLVNSSLLQSEIELPKRDFVLTKLMLYGAFLGSATDPDGQTIDSGSYFSLVFRSTYGFVSIYKVNYEYQLPIYSSLEASATKLNDSYVVNYPIVLDRSAELDIQTSNVTDGSYVVAGKESKLEAKAQFNLRTSAGELIRSWPASKGNHTINILKDKVEYYFNGTLVEDVFMNYSSPLVMSVYCEVKGPPVNATLTVPPKAEVTLNLIRVKILP